MASSLQICLFITWLPATRCTIQDEFGSETWILERFLGGGDKVELYFVLFPALLLTSCFALS